jgi:creatinine amidohydrolase
MTVSLALADLTRDRLAEVAHAAVLVIPFGAVEQHGHHLPFGTDFLIVDTVARRAAERVEVESPIVLAPTVPYGSSGHHLSVGGALSLSPGVFEESARDLLCSAAASGFRRVFVLNGHGGNEQLLRVAAQAATGLEPLAVGGGAYWSLAQAALERILPQPAAIPGHAGRFETSLMLALRPDRVETARVREPPPTHDDEERAFWHEDRSRWQEIDGYTDSPAEGTAEEGAAFFDAIVAAVAGCLASFDRTTRQPVIR